MLVVLAGSSDTKARALADRWRTDDVAYLTPRDLSTAGWRYNTDPKLDTAVVEGHVVSVADIEGVLSCLPGVLEEDLDHIVYADRAYVAAEINAFLLAWLSRLPCRVLNRPTATGLCGPSLRREQWAALAARVGIPMHPIRRHEALPGRSHPTASDPSDATVTVLGHSCFGALHPRLQAQAKCLARAAGVELLTVHFSGSEAHALFTAVTFWPDPITDDLAGAIRQYLLSKETLA